MYYSFFILTIFAIILAPIILIPDNRIRLILVAILVVMIFGNIITLATDRDKQIKLLGNFPFYTSIIGNNGIRSELRSNEKLFDLFQGAYFSRDARVRFIDSITTKKVEITGIDCQDDFNFCWFYVKFYGWFNISGHEERIMYRGA